MNILYALNDKFVPQVAAGICSVCENNKKADELNFYVLSNGITEKNQKNFKELVKKYDRNIEIIELGDLESYFDFEFDTLGWSKVIVARILMGRILPKKIKRILYLDGDTIVRGSLEKLWETDLKGNTIGMSIEPTFDPKKKAELGITNLPYYNSGMLLVDLEKWRDSKAEKRILEFYKSKNGVLYTGDQDAINGGLKGEIFTISPKYNFYNIFYQYNYDFMVKLMKPLDYISRKTYEDAVKDPVVIHYLGEERPWRKGNTHKYRKDYEKYLNMTPYANAEKEQGWGLYFICWRIFNIVTKPFPMFRYRLMNILIPKFMDYRKKKLAKEKKK